MSRIDQFTNAHVYYVCLKFVSKRLADERDKKKFLDLVLQRQREYRVVVFAFSVLDDEIHLVAGLADGRSGEDGAALLRYFGSCCPCPESGGEARPLESMEEMVQSCLEVHLLPKKRGYVRLAGDYWWSSLRSYRGSFSWNTVNMWPLLRYLDGDLETARRIFIRMHQEPRRKEEGEFLRDSEISHESVTNRENDDRINLPLEEGIEGRD